MSLLGETTPHRRSPLPAAGAVLLVAALAGAAWLWPRRPAPAPVTPATTAVRRPPAKATGAAAVWGTLLVEASEPGALVVLDGDPAGPAPQKRGLAPGSHRVRVTKDGWEPWEREAQIVPGHAVQLTARLEREAPRLRVVSDVPGATVFLDRKFLGTTPLETRDFGPGPHRLNVSAEGYEMYAETLELASRPREVVVRFKEVRLDQSLSVVHRHGLGSCRGTLRATVDGLRYEASDARDAFGAPFSALEPLQVDYLRRNLRVRLRGGKTYNFTGESADAVLSFQKAVEAARKRL